jgi:galactokinase
MQYTKHIRDPVDLAGFLGTIENGQSFGELMGDRGVGTFGGSEDHTAILCSSAGLLGQFSYCPVRLERHVKLSDDYIFVISSSGVVAEKTGIAMKKYNRASRLAFEAAALYRQSTGRKDPHLSAAIASTSGSVERIRDLLANSRNPDFPSIDLVHRFEHFHAESEVIIPAVADVLEGAALAKFGNLVDRSQQLGAELLGNQVPETIGLAAMARELGAVAASAFGAGFGGSVWALVPKRQVEWFMDQWANRYRAAFPVGASQAMFFCSQPAPAALFLNDKG